MRIFLFYFFFFIFSSLIFSYFIYQNKILINNLIEKNEKNFQQSENFRETLLELKKNNLKKEQYLNNQIENLEEQISINKNSQLAFKKDFENVKLSNTNNIDNELSAESIFQKLKSAIVLIACEKKWGSGFFSSADGEILTNYHVIKNCPNIYIVNDGEVYKAKLINFDKFLDLAVLKIEKKSNNYIKLAIDFSIGQKVFAFGFPRIISKEPAIKQGILAREIEVNYFELDLETTGGNSGGPVVNSKGDLVSIVTLAIPVIDGDDLKVGLHLNSIKEFYNKLKVD